MNRRKLAVILLVKNVCKRQCSGEANYASSTGDCDVMTGQLLFSVLFYEIDRFTSFVKK